MGLRAANDLQLIAPLTKSLFERDITIDPYSPLAFHVRFNALLYQLRLYFLTEDLEQGKFLATETKRLRDLICDHALARSDFDAFLKATASDVDYLRSTFHLRTRFDNRPWASANLNRAMKKHPTMHADESLRFYSWLPSILTGRGKIVELGCWLGSSTRALANGVRRNRRLTSETIFAYDSFRWERWMVPYLRHTRIPTTHYPDRSFLRTFEFLCRDIREWVVPIRAYIGNQSCQSSLPPATWRGDPIELFIYGMGPDDTLEAAFTLFSEHFVPGRTIVILEEFGNVRCERIRSFVRRNTNVLVPLLKPASSIKGFKYVGDGPRSIKVS